MKLRVFCIAAFLLAFFSVCVAQKPGGNDIGFKNDAHYTEALFLAYAVHVKELQLKSMIFNRDVFGEIASSLQAFRSGKGNIDSALSAILKEHGEIDFTSNQAMDSIAKFTLVYEIVDRLVFSEIVSDDDAVAMNVLETKLLKIPALAKIYRLYVKPTHSMGDLASTTSLALPVHIAYYIYTLSIADEKTILKQLL